MLPASDTAAPRSLPHENGNPHPAMHAIQSDVAGILTSLKRVATLQLEIWLTRAKQAVTRIVLFAALSLVAMFVALVAVVFLYAGIYRILTDILNIPSPWALLIFAGVHLIFAGIIVVVALSMIHRNPDKKEKEANS